MIRDLGCFLSFLKRYQAFPGETLAFSWTRIPLIKFWFETFNCRSIRMFIFLPAHKLCAQKMSMSMLAHNTLDYLVWEIYLLNFSFGVVCFWFALLFAYVLRLKVGVKWSILSFFPWSSRHTMFCNILKRRQRTCSSLGQIKFLLFM